MFDAFLDGIGSEGSDDRLALHNLAEDAGDTAGALARSASNDKGNAAIYANQIALVAVGLTLSDHPSNDRLWDELMELWDSVVVRRDAAHFPDPDAIAWRNKPGSISYCLSRTMALIAIVLTVLGLLARQR